MPPEDDDRETEGTAATIPRVPRPRVKKSFEPGTVVDRYVIVEALGRGGMGAVMLAYDTMLSRRVAIKVLHTGLVSEDARARMQREAQAMAQLNHPNVAAIYDVGAYDGSLYLAMEYIDGETLRTWLKVPRPWQEVVRVMKAAGKGLAAAHAAGIIHRDFKPSNVIVAKDGRVCVLDFGIARATTGHFDAARSGAHAAINAGVPDPTPSARHTADPMEILAGLSARATAIATPIRSTSSPPTPNPGGLSPSAPPSNPSSSSLFDEKLTDTGDIVGTSGYFAPETVLNHKADARSDIWSFCISFWRALYGSSPYPTELPAYIAALMDGAPRVRPKKPVVPLWIHKIVERGLSINPAHRFASMEELLSVLSRDKTKERRKLIAAGVAVFLVVLGIGVFSARSVRRERAIAEACAAGEGLIRETWSDAKRNSVRAAIAGSGASTAKDSAARTIQNLDEYGKAWASVYREANEATLRTSTENAKTLEARLACLDVQRAELDALANELAHADGPLATQAVAVTYQLAAPKQCLDPSVVRAAAATSMRPDARERGLAWRRDLSKAEALDFVGKFDAATATADTVLTAAHAQGDRDTETFALKVLADTAEESDHNTEALDYFVRALAAAESTGNQALAVHAASQISVIIGDRLNRPKDAEPWIMLARAKLDRLGSNEATEWEVLKAELIILGDDARYDESLARYPELIALSERVYGSGHPRTATIIANFAYDLGDTGHYDRAITEYRRAIVILEKAWGPAHPNLAAFYLGLAHCLARGGHTEDAYPEYDRALALAGPTNNLMTVDILGKMATLAVRRRDYPRAEAAALRGVPIAESVGEDATLELGRLLVAQGLATLGRRGSPKQANALCARALTLLEPLDGGGNFRADVLRCLGEAALMSGDPKAAITYLERDERLLRHEWPGDLALIRFDLSRALKAAHKDPSRAQALAVAARDELRGVPQLAFDLQDVEQSLPRD